MESKSEMLVSTDGRAALELGTIKIDGREFTSQGAFISDSHCVGYLKRDDHGLPYLATWGGKRIGSALIKSSWRAPARCWFTDRFYSVEVTADVSGIVYVGRCAGFETLYRGKHKAKQVTSQKAANHSELVTQATRSD